MLKSIVLNNLTSQKGEVMSAIAELKGTAESEKILQLTLNSTLGTIPEGLEIIQMIHTSPVDLTTDSTGELSPAGLLIAAAGKPDNRKAHYSTIFKLSDIVVDEKGKKKSTDPYLTSLLETLCGLGARRKNLTEIASKQSFITANDAKKLKIIDDAGLVKNKYGKDKDSKKDANATQEVTS